jgi:hypothetical protein
MNCSNPSTATAAAHRLPEQLETATARQLLLTAAARQHTAVVEHLVGLSMMLQHLDESTLEKVFGQLLAHAGCLTHAGSSAAEHESISTLAARGIEATPGCGNPAAVRPTRSPAG